LAPAFGFALRLCGGPLFGGSEMMGHRERCGGDEWDALTRAKRFHRWRSGVRAWIKRRFNKRQRKLSPYDPQFERHMAVAREVMAEDLDMLRDLAKR
jgi:hypothetical protein